MSKLTDIATTLYNFWSGFGITAFANEPAELSNPPFLIYNVNKGQPLGQANEFLKVYFSGKNTKEMYELVDKINDRISSNITLYTVQGNITIYQISWQYLADTETTVGMYGDYVINYNYN